MRKWELITDLFSLEAGCFFTGKKNHLGEEFIILPISGNYVIVYPQDWPKYFRLVEEPEFTESDMIEAMQKAWNSPIDNTLPIIETIRKRKAGK